MAEVMAPAEGDFAEDGEDRDAERRDPLCAWCRQAGRIVGGAARWFAGALGIDGIDGYSIHRVSDDAAPTIVLLEELIHLLRQHAVGGYEALEKDPRFWSILERLREQHARMSDVARDVKDAEVKDVEVKGKKTGSKKKGEEGAGGVGEAKVSESPAEDASKSDVDEKPGKE